MQLVARLARQLDDAVVRIARRHRAAGVEQLGAEPVAPERQPAGVELDRGGGGRLHLARGPGRAARLVDEREPHAADRAAGRRHRHPHGLRPVVEEHAAEVRVQEIDVERALAGAAQGQAVEPGHALGRAVGADGELVRALLLDGDGGQPRLRPLGRAAHDVGALPPVAGRPRVETQAHATARVVGAEIARLHLVQHHESVVLFYQMVISPESCEEEEERARACKDHQRANDEEG